MLNNKLITIGCQVWANIEATDPNLVRSWCRHYSSIDYIDRFVIKLHHNIISETEKNYFVSIFHQELNNKEHDIILNFNSKYTWGGMKHFHNNNLKNTDIYIPRDIDELVDFEVLNKDIVTNFIESDAHAAIMGFTRDRICMGDNNKLILKDVSSDIPLKEQFPITQQDYGVKLRRSLKKIILIKSKYNQENSHICGGGAHSYSTMFNGKYNRLYPSPYVNSIPVDHYCWIKSSIINRKLRINECRAYKTMNKTLADYFIVDNKNLYSRILTENKDI